MRYLSISSSILSLTIIDSNRHGELRAHVVRLYLEDQVQALRQLLHRVVLGVARVVALAAHPLRAAVVLDQRAAFFLQALESLAELPAVVAFFPA